MSRKIERGVSIYPLRDATREEFSGLFLDYIRMHVFHDTQGSMPVHGAIELLRTKPGELVRLQILEEACYGTYVLLQADQRITHRPTTSESKPDIQKTDSRRGRKKRNGLKA